MRRILLFTLLGFGLVFLGLTKIPIIHDAVPALFGTSETVIAGLEERVTFIDQLTYLQNLRRTEPVMDRVKAFNKLITTLIVAGKFGQRQYPINYKTLTESDQHNVLNAMAESYWYQVQEQDYLDAMKIVANNKPYFEFLREAIVATKILSQDVAPFIIFCKTWRDPNFATCKFTSHIWTEKVNGNNSGLNWFEMGFAKHNLEKSVPKWKKIFSHPEFVALYNESIQEFYKKINPNGEGVPMIFNPIESYSGDKLLLFGGHDNRNNPVQYKQDSKDWYTLDVDPSLQPDCLADVTSPATLQYLQRKKFSVVVNESGNHNMFREATEIAANVLKDGGVYVAGIPLYLLTKDFKTTKNIEKWVKSKGFSQVIFFNPPEFSDKNPAEKWWKEIYWFKQYDAPGIIKIAKEDQLPESSSFIAIK